jgi:shikimate dehydrogenase
MVKGTTKLLGIIGDPVTYSLSPLMHNSALALLGQDCVYVPMPVKSENLAGALIGLEAIVNVQGFNVTIPHKEAILPLLAEVSDLAQAVGAVNTVKRTEQGWQGTNTDVDGFLHPLTQLEREWTSSPVVVLGSGGASKAVVAACLSLSCPVIHVVGRDHRKMKQYYHQMTSQLRDFNLRVHTWQSVDNLLEVAQLVVNTTPLGMASQLGSPLTTAQLALLPAGAIVYDLIYTPRPTELLRSAQQQNLITIDGLEMLLFQGVSALEFWLEESLSADTIACMRSSLYGAV